MCIRDRYQSILKIGSFNQFMSYLPGVGTNLLNKANEKEGINRVKKFLCILDSMTAEELDSMKPLADTRIVRIAKGSGAQVNQVRELIEEHKRLKKLIEGIGKTKLGKGNDLSQLTRNPNQLMSQMSKAVDPRMLQQLGGMGNLMNMMKEMGKMEGGGLGDMMKMFKKK
eukprot:TRINITY_DN1554_c0_g1_i15.p2 TRINITY_DN1554_c0_g1~~TRINITY_DN1554_c0_g1_i15.p2  ORF type:complete len:169 (-),score=53.95 TRINITY_DN1554_c0_g1_i15:102-608(-)